MDTYKTNQEVMNSVMEINERLQTEEDGEERTRLLFEQMLRGIQYSPI